VDQTRPGVPKGTVADLFLLMEKEDFLLPPEGVLPNPQKSNEVLKSR